MPTDRYAYAPIVGRPRLSWPEGKRMALWVVPNVEHYEFEPSAPGVRNPWIVVAQEAVFDHIPVSHHAISLFDMDRQFADVVPVTDIVRYFDGLRTSGSMPDA